jgi:hypothetical protein
MKLVSCGAVRRAASILAVATAATAALTGTASATTLMPTHTVASATPSVVDRSAPITYSALTDDMVAPTSVGDAQAQSVGNYVKFWVDGAVVEDCEHVLVSYMTKIATCASVAPDVAGPHTLTADFSGDGHYNAPSSGLAAFTVTGPTATVPSAADFGPVTLATTAAKTVTVSNSGTTELALGDVTLAGAGAFTITADGCGKRTLEPGTTCDVALAFAPTVAGAVAATLTVTSDAANSPQAVAITGTGVAVAAPPVSTPTPVPPPAKGAVFAPGASPAITATVPRSGQGTPTVAVPLSCPAAQTCELDGSVTIATTTLARSARASAAASATATVARFSKIKIAAGKVKTVKLNLSKAFVKKAQKQGIRRIKATLTINTTLGSGAKITTHQQITVLLPKAAKRHAAAPKVAPHFTG